MLLSPDFIMKVKEELKERGWNQQMLADRSGTTKSSVSRMILNDGAASTVVVSKVARCLAIEDPSAQLHDPDIQRLTHAGVVLKKNKPQEFQAALEYLESMSRPIVAALKAKLAMIEHTEKARAKSRASEKKK